MAIASLNIWAFITDRLLYDRIAGCTLLYKLQLSVPFEFSNMYKKKFGRAEKQKDRLTIGRGEGEKEEFIYSRMTHILAYTHQECLSVRLSFSRDRAAGTGRWCVKDFERRRCAYQKRVFKHLGHELGTS